MRKVLWESTEGQIMPSETRIRSELDLLKATVPESCKETIALVEAWLGRKMVEKKETPDKKERYNGRTVEINYGSREYKDGWNDCIDVKRLASIVREEEIFEIAKQATVSFTMAREHDNFSHERHLAHAITSYVNGRREK
jgi:hypothetical protein